MSALAGPILFYRATRLWSFIGRDELREGVRLAVYPHRARF
jgi:hypothetical protein